MCKLPFDGRALGGGLHHAVLDGQRLADPIGGFADAKKAAQKFLAHDFQRIERRMRFFPVSKGFGFHKFSYSNLFFHIKVALIQMSKVYRVSEARRKNMQAIKPKNSLMELTLRKALWKEGLRYRIHVRKVFGNPDIVFHRHKLAIFCDSEFWHGYDWQHRKKDLKTNKEFWVKKIESNIKRDRMVSKELAMQGWRVLRFWELRV